MAESKHAELEARIGAHLDKGDFPAAASEAMRGYGPQILGYLAVVLRDDDVAADAFSMFAEDLWRGLPGFRREATLRVWAYALASRCVQRTLRANKDGRVRRLMTSEASQLADEVRTSLPSRVARNDELARLRAHLTPEEQALLVLRVDRDLPWSEVAVAIGEMIDEPVSEAALRKRFERLKEKLRDLMGGEGDEK